MKHKVLLEGRQVSYTVRINPRAKHVRIKVDPLDGVKVTMPADTHKKAHDILQQHATWVLKHIDRLAEQVPQRDFADGETLPVLGVEHNLKVIPNANTSITTVKRQDNTLLIRLASDYPEDSQRDHIRKVLERWFRKQARPYLTERTDFWAAKIGVEYQGISIKGQRTRWGSCSVQGHLNYNWKLMMAPPEAIDYLVIHELCHLIEMNHSPAFWAIVESYCLDFAHWKRWLRENAYRLQL